MQISDFAKREESVIFLSLKVQKDLYLFLISHFRIIKKHFVLSYDEGKGPSTGVEIILPSNFVLREHSVCHFGTDETFSRWQRTIQSILTPVLLLL